MQSCMHGLHKYHNTYTQTHRLYSENVDSMACQSDGASLAISVGDIKVTINKIPVFDWEGTCVSARCHACKGGDVRCDQGVGIKQQCIDGRVSMSVMV